MPSNFQQAAEIIQQAKDDVLLTLQGHEHEGIIITVTSALTRLINQLNFLSGANPVTHAAMEFPPITNFFGDEIVRPATITKEDITPTLTEKEIFLNKVAALQSTIRERQPETLITDFSNEPLVLRKVAKNAGLQDYEDGIINIDFIERIKEGLTNNELIEAKEKEINEKLAGEAAMQNVPFESVETLPIAEDDINPTIVEHAELVATTGKSKASKK
jgi:hypothetical protein